MREDLEVALAGLPLLPAEEQTEFIEAVLAYHAKTLAESAESLAAGCAHVPVDKRVAKYVKLRDARAAANKVQGTIDDSYKRVLSAIEASLVVDAQAQGVSGFKTPYGTTYTDTKVNVTIADDNAFYSFVRESGDLDFFERRVKAAHVKEYQEANNGQLPPGLNVFRELTMKIRRA